MEMHTSPADHATVTLEIEADIAAVWEALTSDGGVAEWLGTGSTFGTAVGDALVVHDLVTGETKHGRMNEIHSEHRLGFTWWPATDPSQASEVAITLVPSEAGTQVTVAEVPVAAPTGTTARAMASAGGSWVWRTALLTLVAQAVALRFASIAL